MSVAPGQFSQDFVNGYPSGTTFCLVAGIHDLSATVNARDGDSYLGAYGAVLDGLASTATALGSGPWPYAQNVTVSGITFQGFTAYVIGTGRSWTVSHDEVSGGTTGVAAYAGTTISYSYVHGAATYGIAGFQGSNTLPAITVSESEIAWNGGTPDAGGSSGGTKFSHTTTILSHNSVHDNTGPVYSTAALWCDYDNLCTFESNLITHNGGAGILQEMDNLPGNSGTIRANTLQDNCQLFLGQGIAFCADVQMRNSNNVVAYGNTIVETTTVNPVAMVLDSRAAAMGNNSIHDNTVTSSVGYVGFDGITDRVSNVFDSNTYSGAPRFTLDGSATVTWSDWQAAGQDLHGVLR